MDWKLIAMDLDGTLMNDDKAIDPPTHSALMAAQAAGIRLLLASARPLPGLYRERDALSLQRYGGLLMAYNGGVIAEADTGRVRFSRTMALPAARQVLRQLEALPVTPILDDGKQFYVTRRDGYMVDYECRNNRMDCREVADLAEALDFEPWKILLSADPAIIRDIQARIAGFLPEALRVVQTAPFYLEIIPTGIDKGTGLEAACRALGLSPQAAIAFGDAENDIGMLRTAGMGVAMGNADERVKAAARRVTLSNNDNGIAAALKELLTEVHHGA
ncbi:MAG: HAD family phosphatase [Clostridia bacterium]|nr:HAD family phosphatase [Clostridia bacterium]